MSEINTNRFVYLQKIPEKDVVEFYYRLDRFSDCVTNLEFFATAENFLSWAEKQIPHVQVLVAASVEQTMFAIRSEQWGFPLVSTVFDLERAAHKLYVNAVRQMPPVEAFHASAAALDSTEKGLIKHTAENHQHLSGVTRARALDDNTPG